MGYGTEYQSKQLFQQKIGFQQENSLKGSARKVYLALIQIKPTIFYPKKLVDPTYSVSHYFLILGWPGMKPLSWPSQFIFWQQRAVKTYFQENSLSH